MNALLRWLAMARSVAMIPWIVMYLAACDLLFRVVTRVGSETCLQSAVAKATHGLMFLLRVFWGLTLRLDPRLSSLLAEPRCTIVAANHQSPLDIAILMHALCNRPTYFVCRNGMEKGIPAISPVARKLGTVLRRSPRENALLLRGLARRITSSQGIAVIFPEGRKTQLNYPNLLRFKPEGLARLTASAPQARVISLAIRGSHSAWPGPWRLPKPGSVVEVIVAGCWHASEFPPPRVAGEVERTIRETLVWRSHQASATDAAWIFSPTH